MARRVVRCLYLGEPKRLLDQHVYRPGNPWWWRGASHKASGKGIYVSRFPEKHRWLWDKDLQGREGRLVSLDSYT